MPLWNLIKLDQIQNWSSTSLRGSLSALFKELRLFKKSWKGPSKAGRWSTLIFDQILIKFDQSWSGFGSSLRGLFLIFLKSGNFLGSVFFKKTGCPPPFHSFRVVWEKIAKNAIFCNFLLGGINRLCRFFSFLFFRLFGEKTGDSLKVFILGL